MFVIAFYIIVIALFVFPQFPSQIALFVFPQFPSQIALFVFLREPAFSEHLSEDLANSPLETHEEKQSKWSQEFKSFVVLSRSIHWIEPISEIVLWCAFSEQFSTEKSSNIEWSDSTFTAQVIGLNMFLELSAH